MKKITSFLLAMVTLFCITACNSPAATTATTSKSELIASLTEEQLLAFAIESTYNLSSYEADVRKHL